MCYFHPHPLTHFTTNLLTNTLSWYLPNPTYMATPTYLFGNPINLPMVENDQEKIKWKYAWNLVLFIEEN